MSSSVTFVPRERFFLLAPLKSLHAEHVQGITTKDDLKKIELDENLAQYAIGEYQPAIITDYLFSFFRFTTKKAFLIVIDKRSNSNAQPQRYNFYGLLSTFGKGNLVATSVPLEPEQWEKSVNLTNVVIKSGQVYILELIQLSEDYDDKEDWWMRDVIYEILLASYQDSNDDGYGDLCGLRQRLDYIQSLGVKTIWLTPIQPTMWKDYGYDISHFCDVDPRFGTLEDFRQLADDVHSRNMRLIIDFVPNHTSIEHPWFQAALRNDPQYVDYYIWHEGKNNGRDRPTNWIGASGQPMWTLAPERNMYYLHQFLDCQPDLNYRNKKVVEEMDNVLRFWLAMGVDGFRVDAVRHLFENDRFLDEPLSKENKDANPKLDYDAYEHTETGDQPGSYELVRHWRQFLDDYSRDNKRDYLVLLTEAYSSDVKKVMNFFAASRSERGTDVPLNFYITYYLDKSGKEEDGIELNKQLSEWQDNLPEGAWSNWCLGSHDSRRVTSRLPSKELIDGFYMLLLLQTGTAVVYYGDEIGMCDRPFTLADRDKIVDITAFNYGDENVADKVRDCQRTPMQWTSKAPHAGFTAASTKPFLPLADTWPQLNVEQQQQATRSHLKLFQQLAHLRRQAPFYGGHQKKVTATKEVYAFIRWLGSSIYLIVINVNPTGHDAVKLNMTKLLKYASKELFGEVIARSCNIADESFIGQEGNQINLSELTLESSEAVLFKLLTSVEEIPLCQ